MTLHIDWKNLRCFTKGDGEESHIRLTIVGDWCPASGGTGQKLIRAGKNFYSAIDEYLENSDLNVFNLETTIGHEATPPHAKSKIFLDCPETLDSLRQADFHLACLANNHIMDNGPDGLRRTIEYFRSRV